MEVVREAFVQLEDEAVIDRAGTRLELRDPVEGCDRPRRPDVALEADHGRRVVVDGDGRGDGRRIQVNIAGALYVCALHSQIAHRQCEVLCQFVLQSEAGLLHLRLHIARRKYEDDGRIRGSTRGRCAGG